MRLYAFFNSGRRSTLRKSFYQVSWESFDNVLKMLVDARNADRSARSINSAGDNIA